MVDSLTRDGGATGFFGVFKKINFFFGYDDFVDILLESPQIGLYLGVIIMHFRVFSLGEGT